MRSKLRSMEKHAQAHGNKSKEPKIMIGVPSNRDLNKEFVARLLPLAVQVGIENLFFMQNGMINQCRDSIVKIAFERNYDYIMWIDDDMLLPADAIQKLLAHDKDIVSGLYFGRKNYKPLLFDIDEEEIDGEVYYGIKNHLEYPENSLMQIDAIGFGCVLTKVSALRRIWNDEREGIGKTCFDFIGELGEDLSFGIRCRQCGLETWVDTSIKCGHLSNCTVTEQMWLAVKDLNKAGS